jgi:glycosyltransferase involved in cell wall biosynthesis
LDSIEHQKFKDFECLLINDGSTDKSPAIIRSYTDRDSRFKCFSYKNNSGVASARQLGLEKSVGELVGWVDPDDFLHDDYFLRLHDAIVANDASIVFTDFLQADVNGNRLDEFTYDSCSRLIERREALYGLAKDWPLPSQLWNKLYKKGVFNGVSFNKKDMTLEDYRIQFRLFQNANRIYYEHFKGYVYTQASQSLINSVTPQKLRQQLEIRWERYKNVEKSYPEYKTEAMSCFLIAYILSELKLAAAKKITTSYSIFNVSPLKQRDSELSLKNKLLFRISQSLLIRKKLVATFILRMKKAFKRALVE